MRDDLYKSLKSLAQQNHIEGLSLPSLAALNAHQDGHTIDNKARQFLKFQRRINKELL